MPRQALTLLAILMMTAWSSKALSTPVQNPGNGHYYERIMDVLPWLEARDRSTSSSYLGVPGHLATISNAPENDWIVSTFVGFPGIDNLWLGSWQDPTAPGYSEPAGGWVWVTGEPMSYTNWSSGEPNGGLDSDYMEIKGGGDPVGSWNDLQNNEPNNRGYIVEYDVTPGPAPPTPGFCDATDNSSAGVLITWSDVPNEAGYQILRDNTPIGIRGANVTSFTDVPPAGSYLYCVQAFNGTGTSAPCCDGGTKLLAPPLAPSPCSASDNSPNNVTVSWTDVLDESGYVILRNGVQVGGLRPANSTTYVDFPGPGTFTYCVFGVNSAGQGNQCCDSGRQLPPPPPAPSSCNASDNSTTAIVFAWTDVSGEDGYRIFRNASLIGTVGANVLSFVDNTVPVGITFQYCVAAYNVTGQSSTCCDLGTRINPPAGPSMDAIRLGLLLALLGVAGAVALKWRG